MYVYTDSRMCTPSSGLLAFISLSFVSSMRLKATAIFLNLCNLLPIQAYLSDLIPSNPINCNLMESQNWIKDCKDLKSTNRQVCYEPSWVVIQMNYTQ